MAFTYGISNIKLTNITSIEFAVGTVDEVLGANLKDGVSFIDSPDKSIKTADGIERPTSEKTLVKFQVIGLTALQNTTLKSDLHGVQSELRINLTNGLIITISAIFNVLNIQIGNDIPYLEISCEQSAYDVDTISVITEA